MAALLADLEPGDEVIMPSYTFVSTANAFVLRGAVPVFVDIRPDTLNIDENADRGRDHAAHAGDRAGALRRRRLRDGRASWPSPRRHELLVIEDAAQGVMSSYKGRPLGSIGHLAALSFHETKNIISGEGGALLVNDARFAERAEIIREKGTNRSQFFRGQVDKYTWVDVGSSYLPGEIIAAFLWAQMEEADAITRRRLAMWNTYHQWFAESREGRQAAPPGDSGALHAQRAHVLRAAARPGAAHARHPGADACGGAERLPLHPAAQRAGRAQVRPRAR